MKFSIRDFFSKCDQIRSFLRIWSHLLKKSLMENFIFCAVETSVKDIILKISIKQLYEHIDLSLVFFPSHNADLVKCSGPMVFFKLVASKT